MVTVKIILDTRYKMKSNKYPIKLRVTYNRKQPLWKLNEQLTKTQFKEINSKVVPAALTDIKQRIKNHENTALDIIKALIPFNAVTFDELFSQYLETGTREALTAFMEKLAIPTKTNEPLALPVEQPNMPEPVIAIPALALPQNAPEISLSATKLKRRKFSLTGLLSPFAAAPLISIPVKPFPPQSLIDLFRSTIYKIDKNECPGTSDLYRTTLHSLLDFKPELQLEQVTEDFLNKYEQWMVGRGRAVATIGIYLRNLRAIYNTAISEKLVTEDSYPFGIKKYNIPVGKNVKKAIDDFPVKKLLTYVPENEQEDLAKDFWFLSYFANGLNLMDICLLRYPQWKSDFIVVERRAKTKKTSNSNILPIVIPVHKHLRKLIEKRRAKRVAFNSYLFPVLSEGMTARRRKRVVCQLIKQVNKYMCIIAKKLQLDIRPLTMEARHSFATKAKRAGATNEFMQEALGHADPKTSKAYFAGFLNAQKIEQAQKAIAFIDDLELPDIQEKLDLSTIKIGNLAKLSELDSITPEILFDLLFPQNAA